MNIWLPGNDLDVKAVLALTDQTRDRAIETGGLQEFIHEAVTLLVSWLGGFAHGWTRSSRQDSIPDRFMSGMC
jgi:hypothetical protein